MFSIDYASRVPIYEQIVVQVERLIATGVCKAHEQLPSVRQAASSLGINPNTIQKAYGELEKRGYIYSVTGKGYFVCETLVQPLANKKEALYQSLQKEVEELLLLGESKETIYSKVFK